MLAIDVAEANRLLEPRIVRSQVDSISLVRHRIAKHVDQQLCLLVHAKFAGRDQQVLVDVFVDAAFIDEVELPILDGMNRGQRVNQERERFGVVLHRVVTRIFAIKLQIRTTGLQEQPIHGHHEAL